jgi:hypothetical protein
MVVRYRVVNRRAALCNYSVATKGRWGGETVSGGKRGGNGVGYRFGPSRRNRGGSSGYGTRWMAELSPHEATHRRFRSSPRRRKAERGQERKRTMNKVPGTVPGTFSGPIGHQRCGILCGHERHERLVLVCAASLIAARSPRTTHA